MSRSRDGLVRATFELERDIVWAKTLEARLKAQGLGSAEISRYREQWNQHTLSKDWEWWKGWSKRYSTGELDEMRLEGVKRLGALGLSQGGANRAAGEREQFRQVLEGAACAERQAPERSREEVGEGREP